MRVAYVHDWLVTYRGGEKVLEALLELYPEAPVYTLFYDSDKMPKSISSRVVHVPKILNLLKPLRKALLPWLPAAIEALPLEDYDLVISTSSCVAKGVIVGPHAKHLSYIHSPMRYIWDQRKHYIGGKSSFSLKDFLIHVLSQRLRIWDFASNARVDCFVANSRFVASRVKRYYARPSKVIHPPVAIERFFPSKASVKEDYFLVAGAFVNYKRFDLAILACERLGLKLKVVGDGPDEARLRKLAGANCEFVISPSNEEWVRIFQGARGFLFPGVEDFGITAIEALAAGTPLIAYRAGGALDFVTEGSTGIFFDHDTVESLVEALQRFLPMLFSAANLRAAAEGFSKETFLQKIREEIRIMHEG